MAAVAVVRAQNRPSRKITQMPGVKKPVNSWMYWKPWSKLPSNGLRDDDRDDDRHDRDDAADHHQRAAARCSGFAARYRSIVKMVAIELIFDPVDATIAATSAANTRPLMPTGSMAIRLG